MKERLFSVNENGDVFLFGEEPNIIELRGKEAEDFLEEARTENLLCDKCLQNNMVEVKTYVGLGITTREFVCKDCNDTTIIRTKNSE